MGVAVQLLDAVKDKLNATSFSTALPATREILPDVEKKSLVPKIVVALQSTEGVEVDRTREQLVYSVVVGVYFPTTNIASYETALDLVEEVQDYLSDRDNRKLAVSGSEACLVLPFVMDSPYDIAMLKETNVFFAVTMFKYRFTKNRS